MGWGTRRQGLEGFRAMTTFRIVSNRKHSHSKLPNTSEGISKSWRKEADRFWEYWCFEKLAGSSLGFDGKHGIHG